ncbi:MAG TPA: hypothetical protein EYG47_00660 [Cycloclasticus sp.]|jgi:hypothetical protein|nr:hypothetical protein [Cycloclasticus sp.]
MNIIKTLISIALLTLLSACADDDYAASNLDKEFSINGVFGINLGTVDEVLPEGYIIENKAITFIPNKADERFVKYEYSTTPKSHVIYGIKTKSLRELSKEDCFGQRDALIEQTLDKLGDTSQLRVTQEKNKWKIREANQRQITIDCEVSISPDELQLVMVYQDTSLSLMAFKEWKKRQTEITLIRF